MALFKSDGGTCFPDGGSLWDKIKADVRLMLCIWRRGLADWRRLPVNVPAGIVAWAGVSIGRYWHFRWIKF